MSEEMNTPIPRTISGQLSQKGGSNDFVRKLFNILEGGEYTDIVCWTETGDSFVVLNTNDFTTKILPKHFKHSNFASFVRQLNKYDFHKVKRTSEEKQNSQYGEHSWEFNHPYFKIHDEDSLDKIKRKTATQKKILLDENTVLVKQNPDGSTTEADAATNLILNSTVNKTKFNHLKKRVDSLEKDMSHARNDNYNIKLELQKLNSKYNTVLESFLTLKSFNDTLINNFNTLTSSLAQQGLKIPPNLNLNSSNIPRTSSPMSTQSPQIPTAVSNPLPIPNPPQAASASAASSTAPSHNVDDSPILRPGFHVLLVEDDSVCIQLCSKFLLKYGCSVEVVTDGLSAISTLEKFRYDLVLMDIVMPNLDGATATSIVRSFDNQTPIIAMTGNIEDQDLVTYLEHGMNDILAKPFTKDDLHSMLIRYLKDRVPLSEQRSRSSSQQNTTPLPQGNSPQDLICEEPLLKKQRI